jgi:lipase chaperone LimK
VSPARRRGVAIAVLVATLAVAAAWRTPAPVTGGLAHGNAQGSATDQQLPPARRPAPSQDRVPAPAPAAPVAAAAPVASQLGSDPDGDVALAEDGRLRVDRALRRFFDWHRAAAGELDENGMRARLTDALYARVTEAAAAEALAIYARYVDYLAASDGLPFHGDALLHLDALRALRRALLGDEVASAFFADEEAAIEARLVRRALLADRRLDATARERRLAAVEAALPEELRESPELRALQDAEVLDALYEADGTDPARRHDERAALFGEDAATALARLDHERADWQARVDRYLALQQSLHGDLALSPAERERRLERWLQQNFVAAEQRRLRALEDEGLLRPGDGR